MPVHVTKQEKVILGVLTVLIVIGLIGMMVL
jgi:hypothetical protein